MDLYNILLRGTSSSGCSSCSGCTRGSCCASCSARPWLQQDQNSKTNFSFSQIQDTIFIHILMFVGFFYGYWDNSRCPVCGWWWTRPVKELRWMCSREKGEEPSGSNRNIANTPLHCTINYKTRKKGVSQTSFISLFNFLFLCVSSLQVERPSIYTTQQKMQNQSVKLLDSYWFQIQILKKKERRKRERRIFIL